MYISYGKNFPTFLNGEMLMKRKRTNGQRALRLAIFVTFYSMRYERKSFGLNWLDRLALRMENEGNVVAEEMISGLFEVVREYFRIRQVAVQ